MRDDTGGIFSLSKYVMGGIILPNTKHTRGMFLTDFCTGNIPGYNFA